MLTIRLLRCWEHDSPIAGGISTAIEAKSPHLGALLREVSRRLPQSINPLSDGSFIHNKLDLFWRAIMNADGMYLVVMMEVLSPDLVLPSRALIAKTKKMRKL